MAVPTPAWTGATPVREAAVVYVDDGDTIDVQLDGGIERVRYIGIDAPEIAHDGAGGARGGKAAWRLNQALVGGRRVRLEFDREERDRYGRLLAYVWLGDAMINLEMVRRGYARVLTIAPNVRYQQWFVSAETEARAALVGLWSNGDVDGPEPASLLPARSGRPVTSSRASVRHERSLLSRFLVLPAPSSPAAIRRHPRSPRPVYRGVARLGDHRTMTHSNVRPAQRLRRSLGYHASRRVSPKRG
jgi:endonuclease YncB( thermonuclease family)